MHAADARAHYSAGTTKGTGGDVIILEEAAYVSQDFFYETVAPLLLVGVTTLICISTLTSELSFYTRLFKIKDPVTGLPVFAQFQVSLACDACKDAGMAASCRHMLHLVPTWQSSVRHERLKAVMADRPDLIQSELSGLAFDSLQQCFRGHDITTMLSAPVPTPLTWSQVLLFSLLGSARDDAHGGIIMQDLIMVIDPAAGGPQSDFALITFFRHRGQLVVRHERMYSTLSSRSSSSGRMVSLTRKRPMRSPRSTCRNRAALCGHTGCSPSAAPDCGCSTQ